jgi:hypothetical protein
MIIKIVSNQGAPKTVSSPDFYTFTNCTDQYSV